MDEAISNAIFLVSAILFNLIIVVVYQFMRMNKIDTVKKLGIPLSLLIFPFSLILIHFIQVNKSFNIIISIIIVITYLLIEFLLDVVFQYDFRSKAITHIPYIIFFYMALYSLIVVAFDISDLYGYIVSVCFWILLISLISLIISGKRNK